MTDGMEVNTQHRRRDDGDTNVTQDDALATGKGAYTRPEDLEKGAEKAQLRLLVTLDGSALGDAVIEPALRLATATAAEVRLFSVLIERELSNLAALPLPDGRPPRLGERLHKARRRLTAEIRERLGEIASRFRDAGVSVSTDVDNGEAPALIVEEARAWGADLIMMATHSLSGIVEQLMGSVSAAVVRAGVAPVVLVQPGD
ncbi:MAG: universal stress protein [Dehalococcoidia bacterium]